MCKSKLKGPRFGSALSHGKAHEVDHIRWTRRNFISSLGIMGAGAFFLGPTRVQAYSHAPFLNKLRELNPNRILVLVQLSGGNDGLNTIIPYNDDIYYQERPTLAISRSEAAALDLNGDLGMHPSMAPFESYFGDGQMAIVQNVGYPSPDLSHFRSTDIWMSASESNDVVDTGWIGRYLDALHPDFSDAPPSYPLAVQIGGAVSQMFRGPASNMGVSMISADFFDRVANGGELYSTSQIPDTTYGNEMAYLRSVTNDSFIYAEAIQTASEAGENSVTYPEVNPLARSLETVARLIKGNLGSQIYHVSLGGFDTHANQANAHARLLEDLAEAIDAFTRDLEATPSDHEILTMTFSEFGRRVGQNNSNGTDHGAAAPLFLFGAGVNGGLFGNSPVLSDLQGGNLKYDIDFRTVYATVLQDWFGLAPADVQDALLGYEYEALDLISDPGNQVNNEPVETPHGFELHANYPNPFNPTTTISYQTRQSGHVRLEVFDAQGRRISLLENQVKPAGSHTIQFNAQNLPSGTYVYRLITPVGVQSRKMVLLR